MTIQRALKIAIQQLAAECDMSIQELAQKSGLPPATIYNIFNGYSNNPRIGTIKVLCDGAGITLGEFFSNKIFERVIDDE